ncbi:udp-n-acetyl-d-mannosamine 6-dehydrogenase [Fusarium longipes]|uniref:Udp-n-acetyl-d-mannosamine 6-dehydrogenase n=1 Tax=Fusarium longipes TaxID=694270 RepID=A0A395SLE3_9HYPO|nr:udp-n-acetyl-d-mannosamine 6-dehydrogenase [Fusarium longipes]
MSNLKKHEYTQNVSPPSSVKTPLVAVIGVGFVGAELIDSFSSKYNVLGFDINENRLKELKKDFVLRPNVTLTCTESDLKKATHFLISVPTLLCPDKSINLSYLKSALQKVEKYAETGSTVVIESSVAVGHTRELLGPIAVARGLFAGMSPERVDPGRTLPSMRAIPKVISGLDDIVPGSLNVIQQLYSYVFDEVIPVSSPEVAEMTKLYENCQRMMGIAYANEMANACQSIGIDPFEVCRASATKPFGYLPFAPSVGIGGHCIPINPYYLFATSDFPLLKAATEAMEDRPFKIANDILRSLAGKCGDRDSGAELNPKVLVVGMGFKAGQRHLVNSPGLRLAQELKRSGLEVLWADAMVPQTDIPDINRLDDDDWHEEKLEGFDLIVICHRQFGMDFEVLSWLESVDVRMWCD